MLLVQIPFFLPFFLPSSCEFMSSFAADPKSKRWNVVETMDFSQVSQKGIISQCRGIIEQ